MVPVRHKIPGRSNTNLCILLKIPYQEKVEGNYCHIRVGVGRRGTYVTSRRGEGRTNISKCLGNQGNCHHHTLRCGVRFDSSRCLALRKSFLCFFQSYHVQIWGILLGAETELTVICKQFGNIGQGVCAG